MVRTFEPGILSDENKQLVKQIETDVADENQTKYWEVLIIVEPSSLAVIEQILQDSGVQSFVYGRQPSSGIGQPVDEDKAITFYSSSQASTETIVAKLTDECRDLKIPEPEILVQELNNHDWENSWKEFWKPIVVSSRLAVCPAWEAYDPGHGQLVVYIETTQAFGTGNHETTRLCLEILDELLAQNLSANLLDIGTGSGVLAIVASLRGVPNVLGIDIDPVSAETARENATRNKADATFIASSIADFQKAHTQKEPREKYSLVCANLLSSILLEHRDAILDTLVPNGKLLISGILIEEVSTIITNFGLPLLEQREMGEWAAVVVGKV